MHTCQSIVQWELSLSMRLDETFPCLLRYTVTAHVQRKTKLGKHFHMASPEKEGLRSHLTCAIHLGILTNPKTLSLPARILWRLSGWVDKVQQWPHADKLPGVSEAAVHPAWRRQGTTGQLQDGGSCGVLQGKEGEVPCRAFKALKVTIKSTLKGTTRGWPWWNRLWKKR